MTYLLLSLASGLAVGSAFLIRYAYIVHKRYSDTAVSTSKQIVELIHEYNDCLSQLNKILNTHFQFQGNALANISTSSTFILEDVRDGAVENEEYERISEITNCIAGLKNAVNEFNKIVTAQQSNS